MKAFEYIAVQSIDEACSVLTEHGSDAIILAGGTDLLIEFRRPSGKAPKVVVDISGVDDLGGVVESRGSVSIMSLATYTTLHQSQLVQKAAPLLATAASKIGSPQIRNRGTVGGNIMNASTCADTVPPLIALGATVTLRSKNGSRELNLADLFIKPYQTKAKPDEVLVRIQFPKLPPDARSAFVKLGRRNALSISRLSVAAILQMGNDGRIVDARIVPGAAFPTWRRIASAEEMLLGEKPSEKLFTAAGQKVSEEMIKETGRRWSTEYKEPVIAVLARRAIEACTFSPSAVARTQPTSLPHREKRNVDRKVVQSTRGTCAISTIINGRSYTLMVPPNRTLLDLLRDDLGLLGTKCGCEIGECGACTVLLDAEPVNSCLVLAPQIAGREVLTVEGLRQHGKLHPLQESFMDCDAVHCGFCTPGMLMSAKALLDGNPHPTETEIRTAISGNLCRCTGYQQIINAIEEVAVRNRRKKEHRVAHDSPANH